MGGNGGAHGGDGERIVDKIRNMTYIFSLSEFVPLGPCGLARGSRGCLTSSLNHNRRASEDEREKLFYSNRAQLIEKSRFEKINASKLESIY
jgi:hypothetical protein